MSRIVLSIAVLFLLAASFTAAISQGSSETSSILQSSDVEISGSILFIVQGENEVTVGSESRDDFYVLQITSFELPYDEQQVFVNMPRDAREVNVWQADSVLNESDYGWEQVGGEEVFRIGVPESFPRTAKLTNLTDSESEFLAPGSQYDNTTYSSGALRLELNSSSGQYVSSAIPVAQAHSVETANITLTGSDLANVSMEVSNDAGASWMACSDSMVTNFSSDGTDLEFRLTLNGNASVTSVKVISDYVALTTEYSVHVSYLWTADFDHGKTSIDLTSAEEFGANGSCLLMLYVLQGYEPLGVGANLTRDQTTGMNPYDDKELYLNESFRPNPGTGMYVEISAPAKKSDLWLYSLVAALVGGGVLLMFLSTRSGRSRSQSTQSSSSVMESSSPTRERASLAPSEIEPRRKELVRRKKELLSEIEAVKSKIAKSQMRKGEADAELMRLKNESKAIRNELNWLSRREEMQSSGDGAPRDDYQAVLAAVARIDDDFEKGRLSEDAHTGLRKEYIEKAKRILAEREARSQVGERPVETERMKLMEAIVALDEEHERGEIEDRLYNDLRASYKKQLAEVMKRSEPKGGLRIG
ncbi:MAG TPA: hypothetical protein VGB78_01860 [Thermoplasmata archaeon]